MPFMVDQMVYTNLPNSGFRLLTSSDVPHAAEEVFVKDIVHQLWDAYNPPKATEQSVFVLQIAPTATLFGWIYNDGVDEMGRTSIPYFSCYYHTDELTTSRLEDIVTILGKGPLNYLKPDWLARHTLTRLFVTLPDSYQPARRGVMIASPDLAAMVARVESQELIKYHAVSDGSSARLPGAGHSTHSNELSLVNKTEESALSELLHTDNIGKVVIPQTNLKTTVPQLNAKPPQLNPKATTIQLNSKTTTPQLNPKATTIQSQNLDFETAVLRSFDSLDLAQVTQLLQSALEINPPLVGFMLFDQDVKPLTSFIGDHARLHKHCQEPQLIATVQQCSTLVNESRKNLGLDSLQHIALHMGNAISFFPTVFFSITY